MNIRIATNIAALAALGTLDGTQRRLGDAAAHLASGSRITRAADDAASLSISQGLTTQINGMVQSIANAHDATAVAAIADGALSSVHDTLQRIRQLIVRAANAGGGSSASLTAISGEIGALTTLLNAIADFTASGSRRLLDGSYRAAFQIGPDGGSAVTLDLSRADMHASNLGGGVGGGGIDLSQLSILGLDDSAGIYTVDGAKADLAALSESIVTVSARRSDLGAAANRLAGTVANLGTAITAVTGSRSSLTDADMATEAQRFVSAQITTLAAASVVAQANSAPKAVLRLLTDSTTGSRRGDESPGRSGAERADSRDRSDSGSPMASGEPTAAPNRTDGSGADHPTTRATEHAIDHARSGDSGDGRHASAA